MIEEAWIEYQNTLIPPDTSFLELRQVRRAFYAGAVHTVKILMGDLSLGDTVEMENLLVVEKINREIKAFTEQVVEGLA